MTTNDDKIKKEIESFQGLWYGGFCRSNRFILGDWDTCVKNQKAEEYNDMEKISEICIKPYINKNTVALDIGTDGGIWITQMTEAKLCFGLDCRPPTETMFLHNVHRWGLVENLRQDQEIFYIHDQKNCCDFAENEQIDYVFSYDTFSHISYTGAREYLKNLYPKLKKNANLFIMIADADKLTNQRHRDAHVLAKTKPDGPWDSWEDLVADYDGDKYIYGGRYYFYGTDRFCKSAEEFGYTVIDKDVIGQYDKNNPIIHLRK